MLFNVDRPNDVDLQCRTALDGRMYWLYIYLNCGQAQCRRIFSADPHLRTSTERCSFTATLSAHAAVKPFQVSRARTPHPHQRRMFGRPDIYLTQQAQYTFGSLSGIGFSEPGTLTEIRT
ncbi:hypothetical protein AVEN_122011-1 [Araneus ventricosus]|uniref:Uncharacterized protein n=1 Tax=Araneus ventricosus TaxID=182803 RepID=A0A4Y2RAF9_ARAVE|nr:hypothetical protein AVEN_122011-1 [Araneus ventricosus]